MLLGACLVAFTGAVLGGVVQALTPYPLRLGLWSAAAVAVLLREFAIVRFRVPENRRLVPESVLHRGRAIGGVQFGFEMGTGMRTYSPSALPHLVLLAVLLVLPLPEALLAGTGFALSRWLMAFSSVVHPGDWSALWDRHSRTLAVLTTVSAYLSFAAFLWR